MGKKINQADVKKSQKALLIWAAVIVVLVLAIAIGVAMSDQSPKSADNSKQQVSSQNNGKPANTSSQQAKADTKTDTKAGEKVPVQQQTNDNGNAPTQVSQKDIPPELLQQLKNNQITNQSEVTYAEIQTSKGTIKVSLENKKMPTTVANFTNLVNKGFYNGLTFHRVEDWVIQGGDPNGNGTGGSGQTIPLETSPDLKNVRGALAMARSSDPNSASSQFYILKKDASWLDGQYAVFGNVVSGMDVVDKMEIGDKILSIKIVK